MINVPGNRDTKVIIMNILSDKDARNLAYVNKDFWSIYNSPTFWIRRLLHKFNHKYSLTDLKRAKNTYIKFRETSNRLAEYKKRVKIVTLILSGEVPLDGKFRAKIEKYGFDYEWVGNLKMTDFTTRALANLKFRAKICQQKINKFRNI